MCFRSWGSSYDSGLCYVTVCNDPGNDTTSQVSYGSHLNRDFGDNESHHGSFTLNNGDCGAGAAAEDQQAMLSSLLLAGPPVITSEPEPGLREPGSGISVPVRRSVVIDEVEVRPRHSFCLLSLCDCVTEFVSRLTC